MLKNANIRHVVILKEYYTVCLEAMAVPTLCNLTVAVVLVNAERDDFGMVSEKVNSYRELYSWAPQILVAENIHGLNSPITVMAAASTDRHNFKTTLDSNTAISMQMSARQNQQVFFVPLCSSKVLARNNEDDNIGDDHVEKHVSEKSSLDETNGVSRPGNFSIRYSMPAIAGIPSLPCELTPRYAYGSAAFRSWNQHHLNVQHTIIKKSSNFLREYVFAFRAKNIGKNWPFSQKYLQICLENGREPLLPPFEPPSSVRDLLQKEPNHVANLVDGSKTPGNTSSSQDFSDCPIKEKPEDTKHLANRFVVHKQIVQRKRKSRRRKKKMVSRKSRPGRSLSGNGNECVVAENTTILEGLREMRVDLEEEKETPKILKLNNDTGQGTERELKLSCKTQGVDFTAGTDKWQLSGSADAQADSEPLCKQQADETELPEIPLNVKSRKETCEEKANKSVAFETKSQEDNKKEHAVEKNKAEAGRNEDLVNSGTLLDAVIPKECPVCRAFSSTSNTALNAHIDHCLSVESNVKKSGTKFARPKVKARKKRSMADICAVARTCTLEDLDRSTTEEQWTLDASPLPLDDLNWRDTTKRRQSGTARKVYVDPNRKKVQILSNLKEDCQPTSRKDCLQRKGPVCDERDVKSLHKKSRRVDSCKSSHCLEGAGQSLDERSFKNFKNKVPVAALAKHALNEDMVNDMSQRTSEETLHGKSLPRYGSGRVGTCFHKQEGARVNKVKQKLGRLKEAAAKQLSSNQDVGVSMDSLQFIAENLPDEEFQRSPKNSPFLSSNEAHDIHIAFAGKTDNARSEPKISENNCSPPMEVAEKAFPKLGLQNKKGQELLKSESPFCETHSSTSEAHRGDEDRRTWLCDTNREKKHCLFSPDGNALKSQMLETVAVLKTQDPEHRLFNDGTQSSMSCQLPRADSKGHLSQNILLENSSASMRANALLPESGLLECKEGTNCNWEYINGDKQQARHFECNIHSQRMENVTNAMQNLKNVKDAPNTGSGKSLQALEFNAQSPKTTCDIKFTSNRTDGENQIDLKTSKAELKISSDTSTLDDGSRSNATLASQPAKQYLKFPITVDVHGTQFQLRSTGSTFSHDLQTYRADDGRAMNGSLGIYASGNGPAQLNSSGGPGSSECLSTIPAYVEDISIQGQSNQVTHVLTLPQGKHMNSSLREHENKKLNLTMRKMVDPQSHSGTSFFGMNDASKERVQSFQKQTLKCKPSTPTEISHIDLSPADSLSLSSWNRQFSSVARHLVMTTCLTTNTDITNKYSYGEPIVQQSKSHWVNLASRGTHVINSSDSTRVTPTLNNTNAANRLMTESPYALDSNLRNVQERPHATAQKFVNLAKAVMGSSVCSSSLASSIGLPLTSQGGFLQERSMLLKDYPLVDQQCSFGRSMKLTSVTVPQVVSASLLAGDSGSMKMSQQVLNGSGIIENNPNPCKFQSYLNAVQQSPRTDFGQLLKKQNELKQTQNNSLFGMTDGTNRGYVASHVAGISPHAYSVQKKASTLISCNSNHTNIPSGFHSTSRLHWDTSRNQFSIPDAVAASGLVTTQGQSDGQGLDNVDCSGEPSVDHAFGNPILRLMGKNLMVANKDCAQSRPLETHPTSREEHPNANYLRLLGYTSEEKFWQEGYSLESSFSFDQNPLHPLEAVGGQDSRSFRNHNDYIHQPPTTVVNPSEVWMRNLAGSSFESSAGTNLTNIGPSRAHLSRPSSESRCPPSHVRLASMGNRKLPGSAGSIGHAKQPSPSASREIAQSDHEVIIIDDSPDTEAVSDEPTLFQEQAHQLQEGLSTCRLSKSKSKSGNAVSQSSITPSHSSAHKESTAACGFYLLSAKEIQAELRKLGINNSENNEILLHNSTTLPSIVPNRGNQNLCYVQGLH
eukprot:Gb_12112 [translate_table: standard]